MEVKRIAAGIGKAEGPVVRQNGDIVVTSNSRGQLYRIAGEELELLIETGGGANGAAEYSDGSIYIAQSGHGRPARSRPDDLCGGIQVLAPDGQLTWATRDPVSPNDLCFGPDGWLYFTDPTRGRRDDGRLWRHDPASGETELLCSLPWYPNGLAFTSADDALYVASTGAGAIVRFPFDGGSLGAPESAIVMERGQPDGIAFDGEGNLIVAALSWDDGPGQVQVYAPDGTLLDAIEPYATRLPTNVALTPERTLVITEAANGGEVYEVAWPHDPLGLHPFPRSG